MKYSKKQIAAQQDFLESVCDIFSSADFEYYAEATGMGINWVMKNARYSDTEGIYGNCLTSAIIDGDSEMANYLI